MLFSQYIPQLLGLFAAAQAGGPITPGDPTDKNPGSCYRGASFGGDIQGYTINGPKVRIQNWEGKNFDGKQFNPDWEGPTNGKEVKISPRAIRSYCIKDETNTEGS